MGVRPASAVFEKSQGVQSLFIAAYLIGKRHVKKQGKLLPMLNFSKTKDKYDFKI